MNQKAYSGLHVNAYWEPLAHFLGTERRKVKTETILDFMIVSVPWRRAKGFFIREFAFGMLSIDYNTHLRLGMEGGKNIGIN